MRKRSRLGPRFENGEISYAILELDGGGHRLVWVALLIEELLDIGETPTLILSDNIRARKEFNIHLEKYIGTVDIVWTDKRWLTVGRKVLDRGAYETVIVPGGDMVATTWGIFPALAPRNGLLRLLITRDPDWAIDEMGRIPAKQKARRWAIRAASTLNRNVQVLRLCAPGGSAGRPDLVEDPVILETGALLGPRARAALRRERGMDVDRVWLGIVGAIDQRKNPAMALRAIRIAAASSRAKIGVGVFGPLAADVQEAISVEVEALGKLGVRCIVDNVIRSNEGLNRDIASLDMLVMAYSSHSPNSTMAKAAALGVKVAAAGPPSLRRFVGEVTGRPGVRLSEGELSREIATLLKAPDATPREFAHWRRFAKDLIGLSDA